MIRPEVTIGEMPSSIRVPGGRRFGEDSSGTEDRGSTFGSEPTSVGSQNDPHPVERICRVRGHDAKERDLDDKQSAQRQVNAHLGSFYAFQRAFYPILMLYFRYSPLNLINFTLFFI